MYGRINGWATHILVATGKTDWVKNVANEKGSVMEAVDKFGPEGITSGVRILYTYTDIYIYLFLLLSKFFFVLFINLI